MQQYIIGLVAFCCGYCAVWAQPVGSTLPFKTELVRNFTGHQGSKVEHIAFSADGKQLASAGFDGLIHIIDLKNNTSGTKILNGHTGTVNHVVFNHAGNLLASAGADGWVKVWDIASATVLYEYENAPKSALFREAYFVVFSPDERYVYFGGKNSRIQRAALAADAKLEKVYTDNYHITCGIISPDSRYLVFGCAYEVLQLDFHTDKLSPRRFTGATDFVNDIQISPDGKTLAAWTEDGNIRLWNYVSGKFESSIDAGTKGYAHLSYSKDQRFLASGNAPHNGFRLYDVATEKKVLENNEHAAAVRIMQFSPTDPELLATGSYDGTLRVWRIVPNIIEPPKPPTPPVVPQTTPARTPEPIAQAKPVPEPEKPKADVAFNKENIPTTINNRAVRVKSNIPVRATKLSLEIFDDQEEDGDVVTIYMNDKILIENLRLSKQKKVIPVEISPTEPNVLILYAIEMGKNPPATVAIRILDGIFPQMINLSADPKESQAFNIFLKK